MITTTPEVSTEHLLALAKVSGLIGAYTTAEVVEAVVGYARVVLSDKAVQEAFMRSNSSIQKQRDQAIARIKDMLMGDDGQAWKEAQKFLERIGEA